MDCWSKVHFLEENIEKSISLDMMQSSNEKLMKFSYRGVISTLSRRTVTSLIDLTYYNGIMIGYSKKRQLNKDPHWALGERQELNTYQDESKGRSERCRSWLLFVSLLWSVNRGKMEKIMCLSFNHQCLHQSSRRMQKRTSFAAKCGARMAETATDPRSKKYRQPPALPFGKIRMRLIALRL